MTPIELVCFQHARLALAQHRHGEIFGEDLTDRKQVARLIKSRKEIGKITIALERALEAAGK